MKSFINSISSTISNLETKHCLQYGHVAITGKELEEASNRLAHYLLEQGLQPNALVGIMMERSEQLVITLLGVLKAGLGYVPIDPTFPEERVSYMLTHSEVSTVITDRHYSSIPAGVESQSLMELQTLLESRPSSLPDVSIEPSAIAYVIYTSGSTGVPKGVMVHHGAVTNFLCSMAETPGLTENDSLLAVTTLSFDIAVLELYLPLMVGAKVVVAASEATNDAEQLTQLIDRHNISVMQATPSTWRLLLESGWSGKQSFKALCGGEAPTQDLIIKLHRCCNELWNMYGPTETTVWSSCYKIEDPESPVLLGSAIANTDLHVLNEELQPVIAGQEGELYIGGDGVALGYLKDNCLTAKHFIPHPFSDDADERLYKTGDIVQLLEEGGLKYINRADNQLKIQGHRIELGEIEHHLNQFAAVALGVVVAKEGEGHKTLVAHLVPAREQPLVLDELLQHLDRQLPSYMIPQLFFEHENLPLTPNGKTDRKALQNSADGTPLSLETYLAPRSEIEIKVGKIWEEILELPRIGVYNNIYSLGGHSLLVTRIWSRLLKAFSVDIALKDIFERTTIAEMAALIESAGSAEYELGTIPKCSRMLAPEMSLTQKRFWYTQSIASNSTFYNLCSAFQLDGVLDLAALSSSFNQIISRHEILRTSLEWSEDNAKQVILPFLNYELPVETIEADLGESVENRLQQRLDQLVQCEISLERAPLFNAALLKISDNRHVLFFMPHHVIWDGWSFDLFLQELNLFYSAAVSEQNAELEALPVQYADYSAWHAGYVNGPRLAKQMEYWQETLGGELPELNMPLDHPRPAQFTFNGDIELIAFDEATVSGLHAVAKNHNTTLNVVLVAVYFALLHRYTGQSDLVVGSPVQGRLHPETEDMLGVFVNTLCLRVCIEPGCTFGGLLDQVKEVALEAYQNQEVPFESLVESLNVKRDLSRTAMFQALFTFQEVSGRNPRIGEIDLSQINLHNGTCPTELSFWVKSVGNDLQGGVEYCVDLFDRSTIHNLIGHLKMLCDAVVANEAQPVHALNMLSLNEIQQLLYGWNDTRTDLTFMPTLTAQLQRQCEQTPDSIAIHHSSGTISYRELHGRANRLARYLGSRGVSGNDVVGVCFERTPRLLVTLLALLKRGAAYLPIDPTYPAERNRYILEHAQAAYLISESGLLDDMSIDDANVILLDSVDEQIETEDDQALPIDFDENTLAYIIYTSGSTGQPKGVAVSQRAVVNFLQSMAVKPGIKFDDRVLAITTLSFDIHVLELFLPLTTGASLVLLNSEESAAGKDLIDNLERYDVTLMQATPSTWRLLTAGQWQGKKDLKALAGGEALTPQFAQTLRPLVRELWNMYGPTETTVWSTCCHLEHCDGSPPSIGYPIDNTEVHVIDSNKQLLPVGIPGELHIGGNGLSEGYHRNNVETTARFLSLNLSRDESRRLYATGDLVVRRQDGSLNYISRLDNQVKVRGFRIELGEIESALQKHDHILDSIVIVREDQKDDQRIVAYYIASEDEALTITDLRKHLKQSLPTYMLPQHLVKLQEFPRTLNGKIDRKKLPSPYSSIDISEDLDPCETESEKLIERLWAEFTGSSRMGRNSNFFDVGGHSLLSMHFLYRLKNESGIELTPRDVVFNDLKQLASLVDDALQAQGSVKREKNLFSRFIKRSK